MITKHARLVRGKIILFAENIEDVFITKLMHSLGYEYERSWYYGSYIVKVPYGKEKEAGMFICNKYPEFIESYERIDANMHTAYNECESVISCIESLRDSLGELSNGKTVMPKKWNDNVDSIIEKLKELKY